MSFVERLVVNVGSYILPPHAAFRLARAIFATQGIGWAGPSNGMNRSGEASFLKAYLGKIENPIVLDVGANVGDYASAALSANSSAILHCFEPSVPHFAQLQKRIVGTRAYLNNFGLSERTEDLILHKDSEITGLASLTNRDLSHLNITLDIEESVKLVAGDDYVSQNGIERIDLIKIDVEGWEMSVLNGLAKSFETNMVKCCQFEFGHAHIERRENFRDFWNFFMSRGFRMGALRPNGKVNFISQYDEIYENYYATNYVAVLKPKEAR